MVVAMQLFGLSNPSSQPVACRCLETTCCCSAYRFEFFLPCLPPSSVVSSGADLSLSSSAGTRAPTTTLAAPPFPHEIFVVAVGTGGSPGGRGRRGDLFRGALLLYRL